GEGRGAGGAGGGEGGAHEGGSDAASARAPRHADVGERGRVLLGAQVGEADVVVATPREEPGFERQIAVAQPALDGQERYGNERPRRILGAQLVEEVAQLGDERRLAAALVGPRWDAPGPA